jgi:hypothetical protein
VAPAQRGVFCKGAMDVLAGQGLAGATAQPQSGKERSSGAAARGMRD